jgi:hypothetical protein
LGNPKPQQHCFTQISWDLVFVDVGLRVVIVRAYPADLKFIFGAEVSSHYHNDGLLWNYHFDLID